MVNSQAQDPTGHSVDRVRRSTDTELNRQTDANIRRYARLGRGAVLRRIEALDREWDVKRVLEVNASTLALLGRVLGVTVNKK